MEICCPSCDTVYDIDRRKLTDDGVNFRCSQCSFVFKVRRASNDSSRLRVRRRSSGDTLFFDELTTLHRWIIEGRVRRDDEFSRGGEGWRRLSSISELTPFFRVVDEMNASRSAGDAGGRNAGPANGRGGTQAMGTVNPWNDVDEAPPLEERQTKREISKRPPRQTVSMPSKVSGVETEAVGRAVPGELPGRPEEATARPGEPAEQAPAGNERESSESEHEASASNSRRSAAIPGLSDTSGTPALSERDELETTKKSSAGWWALLFVILLLGALAFIFRDALLGTEEGENSAVAAADTHEAGDAQSVDGTAATALGTGDETTGQDDEAADEVADDDGGDAGAAANEEETEEAGDTPDASETDEESTTADDTGDEADAPAADVEPDDTPEVDQAAQLAEQRARLQAQQQAQQESYAARANQIGSMSASEALEFARVAASRGDSASRLRALERSVELSPSAPANTQLAQLYAASGDAAGARRAYEAALEQYAYAPALLGLADLERSTGNSAAAAERYRRVLEILPSGSSAERARSGLRALGLEP